MGDRPDPELSTSDNTAISIRPMLSETVLREAFEQQLSGGESRHTVPTPTSSLAVVEMAVELAVVEHGNITAPLICCVAVLVVALPRRPAYFAAPLSTR